MSSRTFENLEARAGELKNRALSRRLLHDSGEWRSLINTRILDSLPVGVAILNDNLVLCGQNRTHADYLRLYSPFAPQTALGLTPKELQVAGLIKEGKSSREISRLLNLATSTIEYHRHNIRKKLNITGKKANLRSLLLSLGGDTVKGQVNS